MRHREDGYTLIELIVTILIIGVLSSFAVPQYLRTVEAGKADDAVATVNMIGTTNKMFALDHNNTYATGQFTASCGGGACPGGPAYNQCALVLCRYLADQDWATKANNGYKFNACDPVGGGGGGACAVGRYAVAARNPAANAPYNGWGYTMATSGAIAAVGGAPPATY